ncbi:MAG: RpiB/LacA/LacB family sugar-phosphate isomerase [Anaerolineae bacterium]|jgi:ribose 5-phosphate isomerase RpiB|nr:RpiB/LacA/LacB family sugar-phosphate isomerase [Anaerolineae bacterium]
MKIAVINETSAADRNADIMAALEGRGHEILNVGMKKGFEPPELQYIQTGVMTGLLLHLKRVDLVVGGCGTGQGYLSSAMQYPGVFCGHILTPLDAWLFAQINDGNCMSLMLNQGYGWAGNENLRMIFDAYFSVERGKGYPAHRQAPQRASRMTLWKVSGLTHYPWHEIIARLTDDILHPALTYPGFVELLDIDSIADEALKAALRKALLAATATPA